MNNPIEYIIKQHGEDDSFVFVFPSDIAASLWLEKSLDITNRNTLPSNRFIAWDTFKQNSVKAHVEEKTSVSKTIRNLYALQITQENKTHSPSLFTNLIPQDYSKESETFAPWIAQIIPQLALWESKREKVRSKPLKNSFSIKSNDTEDKDLSFLKNHYSTFLNKNKLFEPSWQRPPLVQDGKQYIIFFPEAIEDFSEFSEILSSSDFIKIIHLPQIKTELTTNCLRYKNIREELHQTILLIESQISQGTRPDTIAVSVPDIETIGPYLEREFFLRNIPVEIRAGKTLQNFQAGRLFSLIQDCTSSNFSFSSVKALLLNKAIPWQQKDLAQDLVQFGIDYHCVSSWEEDGKMIDVWDAAFYSAWADTEKIIDPEQKKCKERILNELKPWYKKFKKSLIAMSQSSSFAKARTAYILFKNEFLDMSVLKEKDDAIIARCISELNALVQIEQDYPHLSPQNPWSFFISHLNQTMYVPQRTEIGVNIFPYRVAAGTPFTYHYVINASMEHCTIRYRQLSFLRRDKREYMRALDSDASAAFFTLYALSPYTKNGTTFFSYSTEGISNYGTAHCFFSKILDAEENTEISLAKLTTSTPVKSSITKLSNSTPAESSWVDPFLAEKSWLHGKAEKPTEMYEIQKKGLTAWLAYGTENSSSFLKSPLSMHNTSLSLFLKENHYQNGYPRVTATSLNVFSVCNTKWFLKNVLKLDSPKRDAELFNDRNLGLLYHSVLKDTYQKIKETDKAFLSTQTKTYKSWAQDFATHATENAADFKGPLAAPLLSMLSLKITEDVSKIIDLDASLLDNWIPLALEEKIMFEKDEIAYYGIIDRISVAQNDQNIVLIDYKSGKVPLKKAYIVQENQSLGDYQIPLYLFLAENAPTLNIKENEIKHAWFGNIKETKYEMVINNSENIPQGKLKTYTRENFLSAENACKEMAQQFSTAVKNHDFTRPKNLAWSECSSCDYRTICRFLYTVRIN